MSDWAPQDDPRHPGESTVVADAAAFTAALDQAMADQDARDQQAGAFLSDVHSTSGAIVERGPKPQE
jgi:hypothetical protein